MSTMPLQIRRGFHLVAHQVLARKHEELTYRAKVGGDGHLLVGMATTAMLNLKPEGESPSSCLRRRESPLSRLAQKTRSEQGKRPHQRVWSHSTNNRQTSFYQSCSRSLRRCRVRGMVDHPKPQSGKVAKMFISWK